MIEVPGMNKKYIINATEALTHWGLSDEPITHIYTSAHNSSWDIGDKYILQQQLDPDADTDRLTKNIRLVNLLSAENIPTVVYIKTLSGEWTTPDKSYSLMEKLKGEHIDFYDFPELVTELGRGLAELHLALSGIETELEYKDYDFLSEWNNYIKPGLSHVSDEIIKRVETKIFANYSSLPRSPIHRDVHSQNVLFCDGKISGWLDFDLNRKDARIFDLAYLLAGLLVGKMNNPSALTIWKIIYRNLLDGYNEISPLTESEIAALPDLMIAIELLFVTYWNKVGNEKQREMAKELAIWLYGYMELICLPTK
jgi:Ser/Thr protein kinase RdoA (MazF antagonist)